VPGSATIRGAIRTDLSTSTDMLVAGQEFSVFVTVFNPFELPLTLHRISTYLPTEFLDVDRQEYLDDGQQQLDDLQEAAQGVGIQLSLSAAAQPQPERRGVLRWLGPINPQPAPSDGGPAVARHMTTASPQLETKVPKLLRKTESLRKRLKGKRKEDIPDELRDEVAKHFRRLQRELATVQGDIPQVLQPGNSTTRVFTVVSKTRTWFTPSTYRLSIEVEYEILGRRNLDTIQRTLQVRASLVSIAAGAVAGAAVGWLVKQGFTGFDLSTEGFERFVRMLLSLVAILLVAGMSVLFIARKKETQPLVSVEDFWGEVVVGFLVAYSGQQIVGPPG
jgi:hypothetical protein